MKKLPKTPGECADALWLLRERRRKAEAVVTALRAEYDELQDHALDVLHDARTDIAAGKRGRVSKNVALVPTVKDWDQVYGWITKHKALDLFERRLSTTAWRERLEAKVVVPGIEPFQRVTLHLTGVKEKA
jgi:hypothetical protein